MRAWAVLGLAVLAACSNTEGESAGLSHPGCVDTREEAVSNRLQDPLPKDDRQAVIVRYRSGVRAARAVESLGVAVNTRHTLVPAVSARLTPEEIAEADFVLLAVDIKIGGRERFEGKQIVEVGTSTVIASPTKLLSAIEQKLTAA